jgi:hypothetical protein
MLRVFTNLELLNCISAHDIRSQAAQVADSSYVCLAPEDITELLTREYSSVLRQTGYEWVENAFDCDNHALWATAWADRWHANNVKAGRAALAGLAFGELWVASKSHAICVAAHWCEKFDALELVAYEPQLSGAQAMAFAPVEMTPEDWQSVLLIKFQ